MNHFGRIEEKNMDYSELSQEEQKKRSQITEHTRRMILSQLPIESQDDISLMAEYRGYYLQVSFSRLHPLMVFCLARELKESGTPKQYPLINELNLQSILGTHTINGETGCYSYRAAHWLEMELNGSRFLEILNRCADEADRGFYKLSDWLARK